MEDPQPFQFDLSVSFADCDSTGQWKPATAFRVLGEAAGGHAEVLGFGYQDSLADGLFWVLSRIKIHFLRYPRFGQTVTVRTWPKSLQQRLFFARDYEVLDEAGERLLAATALWVIISSETRRIQPPERMRLERLRFNGQAALDEQLAKLNLSEAAEPLSLRRVGYSDIDLLGHANNTRYIEWICDSFPSEQFETQEVDAMQINFERELRLGDVVAINHASLEGGGRSYIQGINQNGGLRSFEAEICWRLRDI